MTTGRTLCSYRTFFSICCALFVGQMWGQSLYGNAISQGSNCYRLTQNSPSQVGAVWMAGTVDVSESWEMRAEVFLGTSNSGADGMVFVLRNPNSDVIGINGGRLGYGGIDESLGVEMDTYYGPNFPSTGDITADHIGVQKNGSVSHVGGNSIAGPIPAIPGSANIENGVFHDLRVTYNADSQELRVYFNCNQRILTTVDLVEILGTADGKWGFTAATGGAYNLQRVCNAEWLPWPSDLVEDTVETCSGIAVDLELPAATDNVTWSPSEGLSTATGTAVTATVDTTTIYSVTYDDICGNSTTETVEVAVVSVPDMGLPLDTLLCQGGSIELVNGPWPPGIVGIWEDGSLDSIRSISATGTYSLTLTNEILGCSETESVEVLAVDLPQFDLGTDVVACPGALVEFELGPLLPELSVTWNGLPGGSEFATAEAGAVVVTWGQAGCSESDTAVVVHHPSYEVSWPENPLVLCLDDTILVSVVDPNWTGESVSVFWNDGTMGPDQWISDSGLYGVSVQTNNCVFESELVIEDSPNTGVNLGEDVILCASDAVTFNSGYSGGFTYWISGGTSNGTSAPSTTVSDEDAVVIVEISIGSCVESDTVVVDHIPLFDPGLPESLDLCLDDSLYIEAMSGADAYSWNNGVESAGQWVDAAGVYSVSAPISGCPHTDAVQVVPSANAGVDLGPDDLICAGESVTFSSGYPAAATQWWQNDAEQGGNSTWSVSGMDATVVAEVTIDACISSDTVFVEFVPFFDPGLPVAVSFCSGDSIYIEAELGAPEYLWNTGQTLPGIWITTADNYVVNTPVQGCPYGDAIAASVIPLPLFDLGPDISICEGQNVSLSTGLFLADETYWSTGSQGPVIEIDASGSYSVTVTENGCSASDTATVIFQPLPIFDLGPDQSICPEEWANLYVWPVPDGTEVTWNSGQVAMQIEVNASGVYSATALLNGCSWTDAIVVERAAPLEAYVENLMIMCAGDSMVVSVENEPNLFPESYSWNTGAVTSAIRIVRQGQYSVTVSNACESVYTDFEVRLEACDCSVWVPNAFTPDNDGVNDRFIPVLGCIPVEYRLEVYNKWGQLVFATDAVDQGWVGQVEGSPGSGLPGGYFGQDGMYSWRLALAFDDGEIFKSVVQEYSGSVYLVR